MTLLVNGSTLPIAQMGPDFLRLNAIEAHPPAEARIVMRVDASERSWPVYLPDGIASGKSRVWIAKAQT